MEIRQHLISVLRDLCIQLGVPQVDGTTHAWDLLERTRLPPDGTPTEHPGLLDPNLVRLRAELEARTVGLGEVDGPFHALGDWYMDVSLRPDSPGGLGPVDCLQLTIPQGMSPDEVADQMVEYIRGIQAIGGHIMEVTEVTDEGFYERSRCLYDLTPEGRTRVG